MTEPTLFDLPAGPLDDHTAAVVDIVEREERGEDDRARIDDAVRRVAMRDGGRVSTNAVRKQLTNEHGLTVQPQRIGPRLRALTLAGVLEVTGWEINDDTEGRNSGKPLRVRRWVLHTLDTPAPTGQFESRRNVPNPVASQHETGS